MKSSKTKFFQNSMASVMIAMGNSLLACFYKHISISMFSRSDGYFEVLA